MNSALILIGSTDRSSKTDRVKNLEAVTHRCFLKKEFLKISQN